LLWGRCAVRNDPWVRLKFPHSGGDVKLLGCMVMTIGLNYLIGAVARWIAPWQAEIAGRDG